MTRIIDVENIIGEIVDTYGDTTMFDVSFTINENTYDILSTSDFLSEIETNYSEMSYITHKDKSFDVSQFALQWGLYCKRHVDEWQKILDIELMNLDPTGDYSESRIITPNLTNATTNTYGRTSTNSGGISTTITHGKVISGQTNTYDGVLRDSAKSTESGSTGNSSTDTTKNTLGGSDSATTTTTGTNTETKNGYKNNPFENAQKSIEFYSRFNLRDMIISGFTKECLFYDNGNGGDFLCLPLI